MIMNLVDIDTCIVTMNIQVSFLDYLIAKDQNTGSANKMIIN